MASLTGWPAWPRVAALLERRPEVELYLAGGAVRDAVNGSVAPPNDLDFFFQEHDLEPAAAELARHGRLERTPFGSPRWYPVADQALYCDLMAIQRFHNGFGRCDDIVQVLHQFDFTANAMALDLRTGRFHDPVDGAADLGRRIMRAVRLDISDEPIVPGHELTRAQWLWLRLVHYTAHLGFDIEPETLAWLRSHRVTRHHRARCEQVLQRLHPRFDEVLERHGLG